MEEIQNVYKILVKNLNKRHHLGNRDENGRIKLKWTEKQDIKVWNWLNWLTG